VKNVLLYFAIETPRSLASPTTIRALGEALQELDQALIPDRYGYTDYAWKRFDPAAAEEQLHAVHADHTSVVLRFRRPLSGYISLSASRGPRVPYNGAHISIESIDGGDRFWLQTTEHPEAAVTSEGQALAEKIKHHLGHPKAFGGHDPTTPPHLTNALPMPTHQPLAIQAVNPDRLRLAT
jgi:hypothetical protein